MAGGGTKCGFSNLADAWLHKDLSDQEILDIANYQAASAEMKATPLHKDFLKRENPHEEVIYKEVPELVYSKDGIIWPTELLAAFCFDLQ